MNDLQPMNKVVVDPENKFHLNANITPASV
jgi:hypothetical protein